MRASDAMVGSTLVRVRLAPMGLALVLLASASCADVLGLEDPAGRLAGEGGATGGTPTSAGIGAGSPVTGTGTSTGGEGAGGGGGSTTTGGGAGSTSSTGAGGGGVIGGRALELPPEFSVQVLGRSPTGAVAIVKRAATGEGALCGSTVLAEHLAAVSIGLASCAVLAQIEGPDSLQAVSVEQAGDWVGVAGVTVAGTVTLHADPAIPAVTTAGTAGFFGWWNLAAAGQGQLLASSDQISAGATLPTAAGAAHVVYRAVERGFLDGSGDCNTTGPGGTNVHFTHVAPGGACTLPRGSIEGTLLDAKQAVGPWALFHAAGDVCTVLSAAGPQGNRFIGGCDLAGHLLVEDEGGVDRTFVGMVQAEACSGGPGIVQATDVGAETTWCEAAGAELDRVIPFHLDDTYLHFLLSDGQTAELWKVPRDDGDAVRTAELCTGCIVKDAVATGSAVFVIGDATAPFELSGETIAGGSAFWAWVGLADL